MSTAINPWGNLPKTVEQQTLEALLRIEAVLGRIETLLARPAVIVEQTLCNQKRPK